MFDLGIGNIDKNGKLIKFKEKESDLIQKGIYKLSLLGVVSDWTTDFNTHYQVQFNSLNENHIVKSVSDYITKYEPNTDVKKELQKVPQATVLEKAVWYLLKWTFENIAYNRKQSLKTLSDWCLDFKDSESFKKRIDSYFIFSETTFVLQHIAENPKDYAQWFEAFYLIESTNNYDQSGNRIINKTHIPEIQNQEFRKTKYQELKDSLSRFLESYRNNIGLNFVSGFVRLALDEYEDSDGKERFESSLSSIKETFTQEQQSDFLNRLKALGKYLNEEQKMELCQSILIWDIR